MPRLAESGALAVLLCLLAASCDNTLLGGGTAPPPAALTGLQALTVTPGTATLEIATPGITQRFEAVGTFDDGHSETITDRVTWSVSNPRLGYLKDSSTLVPGPYGAAGQVAATSGGVSASASVLLHLQRQVIAAGAEGATPGLFQGPPGGPAPQVVYPYDGVLMPPNLGSLEVQWQPGAPGYALFQLTLHSATLDLTVYTPCRAPAGGSGCAYTLPRDLWNALSYSNLGSAAAPVALTVRGADPAARALGASPTTHVAFSAADLAGGIYYWTATGADSSANGIFRLDFSRGTAAPFFTSDQSPVDSRGEAKQCVGCHALSHGGDKLSMVLGGGHVSDLLQLDVATRKITLAEIDMTAGKTHEQRQFSNFQSYGPDGSSFVSALHGTLRLLDAHSGAEKIAAIGVGGNATHPDWSLSGHLLAVTRFLDAVPQPLNPDGDNFELYVQKGEIAVVPWNGTAFGAPLTVAPWKAGWTSYYPSVSPDDRFVAYNRAGCPMQPGDCSAYDNPRARIFLSPAIAGGQEIELVRINQRGSTDTRGELTNSWPRFSPFQQDAAGGKLMWLTFSSKRNYGLHIVGKDRPQLWMAAVTLSGDTLTTDPSSPPFWVPAQDPTTNNHIAQWTEQVVPLIE